MQWGLRACAPVLRDVLVPGAWRVRPCRSPLCLPLSCLPTRQAMHLLINLALGSEATEFTKCGGRGVSQQELEVGAGAKAGSMWQRSCRCCWFPLCTLHMRSRPHGALKARTSAPMGKICTKVGRVLVAPAAQPPHCQL